MSRDSVCANICCRSSLCIVLVCVGGGGVVRELGLHSIYSVRALKI
jgi:hypothetical protein